MKALPMRKLQLFGVFAAAVLALAACGKKDEPPKPKTETTPITAAPAGVHVAGIALGDSLGPQKKVTQPTDVFGKKDTIYAAIDTTGTGTAVLNAKWTYRGNGTDVLVREDSQTITPTGPATSEFHVSKPDGWPEGAYRVDISLAGNPAGSKTFTVK